MAIAFGFCSIQSAKSVASAEIYDVVITNGRIIDGAGNPWFRSDIGIRNGRIVKIGKINPAEAKNTIDAGNRIVAPGFIDVHTHVESLFNFPAAENFVRMGVTTLITGNCGSSTADVAEFLGRTQSRPIAVNVATLIGHGTVRQQVMNLDDRAPTTGRALRGPGFRSSSSQAITQRL